MSPDPILVEFVQAIENDDLQKVKRIFVQYREKFSESDVESYLTVFCHKSLEMFKLLFELSAFDVDYPCANSANPDVTLISRMMTEAPKEIVAYLISIGATINFQIDGAECCTPLVYAAINNRFDCAKLIVEAGGNINGYSTGNQTPLDVAIQQGQTEFEEYLRSVGGKTVAELKSGTDTRTERGTSQADSQDPINDYLQFVEQSYGKPLKKRIRQVVPGDPDVQILVINRKDATLLFTVGMSSKPLKKARKKFGSKAELCIWLPPKWKLDTTSLKSAKWRWPVDWLRSLAAYPHNNNAWYKPPGNIICMEEPPKPFARGVKFSSMLLITTESPSNMVEHSDGTRTALYNLMPLFESERQFEKKNGIPALLQAFQENKVSKVVNLKREPVA